MSAKSLTGKATPQSGSASGLLPIRTTDKVVWDFDLPLIRAIRVNPWCFGFSDLGDDPRFRRSRRVCV
jgi:hypothetical protein